MTDDSMPDEVCNNETPRDVTGQLVADARFYRVSRLTGKPVKVFVIEDPETGDLFCRPYASGGESRYQRVDQMSPDCKWEPLSEDET